VAFDEFNESELPMELRGGHALIPMPAGPSVIQFGTRSTIVRNLLGRVAAGLAAQQLQRRMDATLGCAYPLRRWEPFCQGYTIDAKEHRSGKACVRMDGSVFSNYPGGTLKHHRRQGTAQFVNVNQSQPIPLTLTAYSKARGVLRSDLSRIEKRRGHFAERLGHYYCMHLYLDYQDGAWPEIHTAAFTPGTHDWESRVVRVVPRKPVITAMVLLEFHQPEGTAWWDDVSLTQESAGERNLLACPGFEAENPEMTKGATAEYDRRLASLIETVESMRQTAGTAAIQSLNGKVLALEVWVAEHLMPCHMSRELRDLAEMRRILAVAEARFICGS